MIPECCPSCKEKDGWKEVINPFTTGIPVDKHFRFMLCTGNIPRSYMLTYQCEKCGFKGKYDSRNPGPH